MSETQTTAAWPLAQLDCETNGPCVPLTVVAGDVDASDLVLAHFREQVGDALSRRLPISVLIADLENERAPDILRRVCSTLAACAGVYRTARDQIELVIPANSLRPDEAWRLRQEELGSGTIYLLASRHELRADRGNRTRFRQFWQSLWGLQRERHVRLACAPLVRSRCLLLSAEAGNTVLPASAIQAPGGSAWVTGRLDLCRFANARGVIDRDQLQQAIHFFVERGLSSHEQIDWPSAAMRHDSWLNRRLALMVTGIGDLVVQRQHDPRNIGCLVSLRETMRWICSVALARSQRVATDFETLPALDRIDPVRTLTGDRDRWARRWREALDKHATASRNLLVLSPWSMFPSTAEPNPDFSNLLPLLEFADACAFPRPPQLKGWNINDFIRLHQQTWAILERSSAAQRFAERV